MAAETVDTPYGRVPAEALAELRRSFDTGRLLEVLGFVDAIARRTADPSRGLRRDLYDLLGMARTVVDGADASVSTANASKPFAVLVSELATEFFRYVEQIEAAAELLNQLWLQLGAEEDERRPGGKAPTNGDPIRPAGFNR
jgi:hypothetical protein